MTLTVDDAPAQPAPTPDAGRSRRPWPSAPALAGAAALALPFVALAVVALTRAWVPTADVALMELRIADVGGPRTPLTGAYSRLGWNHPGPLPFWLLAVPYRLAGARPVGMVLGTLALHAAAVVGCLAIARRRGGWALMAAVALLLAVVIRGMGAGQLALTWNPDLPVLALALLILATWSVIEGDVGLLPVVVAVSCLSWQSHLVFLPVTAMLTVVAVAAAILHLRRRASAPAEDRRPPSPARLALTTGLTALACLAPIVFEQLTGDPGNVRLIVTAMLHPRDPVIGLTDAAAIAAGHLSPVGTWISGIDPAGVFTAGAEGASPIVLLVPFAAALAAYLAARWAGAHPVARLVALMAGTAFVATVAVTRTTGVPYVYLFSWLRPIAALLWGSVVWALVAAVRARRGARPESPSWLVPVAAIAVAVTTAALSLASLGTRGFEKDLSLSDPASSDIVRALAPATVAATAGTSRVAFTFAGGWCAGELGHGLALQLVEHGTEVAVDSSARLEYSPGRVRRDGEPLTRVELVCGFGAADAAAAAPGAVVASTNLLRAADMTELAGLQAGFRDQLRTTGHEELLPAVENEGLVRIAGGGIVTGHGTGGPVDLGADRVARFAALMEQGHRSAVVLVHPADSP